MKRNGAASTAPAESNLASDIQQRSPSKPHLPLQLLRSNEVVPRNGLSRSSIWRLEHRGAFPKRIQVSVNVVAWLEDEVAAWIQLRIEQVVA